MYRHGGGVLNAGNLFETGHSGRCRRPVHAEAVLV